LDEKEDLQAVLGVVALGIGDKNQCEYLSDYYGLSIRIGTGFHSSCLKDSCA
jgi:hypothetical protein